MTKAEMVYMVKDKIPYLNLSLENIDKVITAFYEVVEYGLLKGENVSLGKKLGKLKIEKRDEHSIFCNFTKEMVIVPERKFVKLKMSKSLKKKLTKSEGAS